MRIIFEKPGNRRLELLPESFGATIILSQDDTETYIQLSKDDMKQVVSILDAMRLW